MKNLVKVALVIVFGGTLLFAGSVQKADAIVFGDRPSWETAVGTFADIDLAGQTTELGLLTAGTPLSLPFDGTTLSFGSDLEARQVPDSWVTWSGGNTPRVLWTQNGVTSVDGFFSAPVFSFGLEMQPNLFSPFDITLFLSDGQFITQLVNGTAGAEFFGYSGFSSIIGMTLSSDVDFAFGRMVMGVAPVPEPATIALLGISLVGLTGAAARRKFKKEKKQ